MQWKLLVALAAASLPSCATVGQLVEKPKLDYRDMRITALSFEGATLEFDFLVTNPNPLPVQLASIDYKLAVDGKQLFAGDQKQGIRIAARGDSPITVPVSVRFSEMTDSLAALFSSRTTVPYALQVGVGVDTPAGALRIPAQHEGDLPLPKVPKARVAGVHLKDMSLAGAEVRFDVEVENRGSFPLQIQGLAYALRVAGIDVGGGEAAIPKLAAGQVATTSIPIRLRFAEMGIAAVKAIRDERLPYDFRGQLDLGAFKHDFTSSGEADL